MTNPLKFIYQYVLIARSGMFDQTFYLLHNPDVRRADVNPLWHFVKTGWKENRDPSENFSCAAYLEQNQDIKTAQINPLVHFLRYEKNKGWKLHE